MPKHTIDDCIEMAREKNGECLSDKFVNMTTKMLWKCFRGHEWYTTFRNIKNMNTWCMKCYHISRKKYTIEDCINFAKEKGGKCLSTNYKNSNTSMKWECKNGHIWMTRFDNIINAKHWCYKCKMHSIEYCQKIAENKGGKCLSLDYKNANTVMKWECKKGHVWNNTFGNILHQNNWCKTCAGLQKHTLEECQEIAKKRNGECLSTAYINLKETMAWRCEYNHVWKACFSSIKLRYTWCPHCLESFGEQMIRRVLESLNIMFESQKKFDDLKDITNLSYDFYIEINNIKICIEYDGKQHYNPVALFGGENVFIKQKKHDEIKTNYCISNNMNLIRIKYNSKNQEKILLEKVDLIMSGDNIIDKIIYD